MKQKAIITDYDDGTRVISNIRNKKGIPFFRENDTYTATRVSTWYDGTPMDDSKVDGSVYLKHRESNEYYLANLPNWGETFLQKPNVDALRNMSSTEILLLKMGYYKGVSLLGYYAEEGGDTPAPIQYYLSDTEEEDDGGSVFEVGGIKLEHEFSGEINVLYFGVVPDNEVDSSDRLDAVKRYLDSYQDPTRLVFPAKGNGYFTTQALNIRRLVSVLMYSPLYTSSATHGILIGESGRDNVADLKLNLIRKVQSDWEDESVVGAIILNINNATSAEVTRINGFRTGLIIKGDGAGSSYNKWFFGDFNNNKVSVLLTQKDGGWVNENLYFGGRFRRISSINNNKDIYGIVFDTEDNSYTNFNNNNFYEPSFEFRGDSFTDNTKEVIPILLKQGQMNKFSDCRDERNNSILNARVFIRTENTAQKNVVEIGYSTTNPIFMDVGENPSTILTNRHNLVRTSYREIVYQQPFLRGKLIQFGTSAKSISEELYFGLSGNSSRSTVLNSANLQEDSIILTSSQGVILSVDTSIAKRFVVHPILHKLTAQGVRINIRCYDDSGNILNQSSGDLVRGLAETPPSYQANFGGTWRNGSNIQNTPYYFFLDNVVSHIDIILSGGSGSGGSRLRGFNVYTLDVENTPSILANPQITPATSQIPTDDSFPVGTFVKDLTGTVFGWEYKVVGGVNTWVAVPNIVNATTTVKGLVNQSEASADTATAPSATYDQAEVQAILTELRDLKTKLRTAGILANS